MEIRASTQTDVNYNTRKFAGVDTIIRLHDIKLLSEFDRAIFSLFHQSYPDVRPVVVTQDFSQDRLNLVKNILDRYPWLARGISPAIINVPNPSGTDIRSTLLNAGLAATSGRYITILDADDFLYGKAVQWLVSSLENGRYAIAFGDIAIRYVAMVDQIPYAFSKAINMYQGNGVSDLIKENFCPIHSFVIDRNHIESDDLYFCSEISRLEDYEFLLRICSKYPANFESRKKIVGVYNWKSDNSNSTITGLETEEDINKKRLPWDHARAYVERTRQLAIVNLSANKASL